ncbi:MAG: hypothetical protein AAF721_11745 [Myxococcota bacterium]
MKRIAACLLFLLPAACDDVGHVVINRGDVCIDREQVLEFRQSGELQIKVKMDCESACVRADEASCEAVIDGPNIHLESQFVWADAPDDDCIMKCETLDAVCTVPKTYPGRYTLIHGDEQFMLDLPSNPLLDCLAPMDVEEDGPVSE